MQGGSGEGPGESQPVCQAEEQVSAKTAHDLSEFHTIILAHSLDMDDCACRLKRELRRYRSGERRLVRVVRDIVGRVTNREIPHIDVGSHKYVPDQHTHLIRCFDVPHRPSIAGHVFARCRMYRAHACSLPHRQHGDWHATRLQMFLKLSWRRTECVPIRHHNMFCSTVYAVCWLGTKKHS